MLAKRMGPQAPVASSNVRSLAYDPEDGTMSVRFRNGGTYFYYDVPPEVFERVKGSDSVGGALHSEVKGVYDYKRVGVLRRAAARIL